MNGEYNPEQGLDEAIATAITNPLRQSASFRIRQRGLRRAIATNAVQMAREHRGDANEPFTTDDADTLVAIMDLLDRVAGG
jgi:hypothetical protein